MKTFFKNRANNFAMLLMALAMAFLACEEKGNTFTDARDGKKYKTVKIGEQVWMAENLNYAAAEGSKCYDSNEEFCQKYGRLYDWETAMKACPSGWRLPSYEELSDLAKTAGNSKKLKSTTGWNKSDEYQQGNGTDEFGFSALPGGYRSRNGDFLYVGDAGYWWGTTKHYVWRMDNGDGNYDYYEGEYNDSRHKTDYGFSIRCVKD
jgi:uncharacterized protein (TIGR02145 family)